MKKEQIKELVVAVANATAAALTVKNGRPWNKEEMQRVLKNHFVNRTPSKGGIADVMISKIGDYGTAQALLYGGGTKWLKSYELKQAGVETDGQGRFKLAPDF